METQVTLLPGNIVYGGENNSSLVQSYRSVGHFLLEQLKQLGNAVLLINGETGEKYTAKYLYNSAVRMAFILKDFGVEQNDVIALCVENSIEFAIAFYAGCALNATISPMNCTYTEGELNHTINLSKPNIIFASRNSIQNVIKATANTNFVKAIIATQEVQQLDGVHSFHSLMNDKQILSESQIDVPKADKKDVSIILYSSGTTGVPKGVEIAQMNILTIINLQLATPPMEVLTTALTVAPWAHIYGGHCLVYVATTGKTVVFFKRFKTSTFLKAIEEFHVTHCFLVPSLLIFLSKDKSVENYNLSSLMVIVSAAGALKAETVNRLKERMGNIIVLQGYGMTETTGAVIVQDPFFAKPGSIGRPQKGVYVKVVDLKTGEALGFNKCGEICIKGNLVMKGYLKNEKATMETIKDEWVHTGDVGYYDSEFNFYIEDRIKDIIKYKSNQVAPAELEYILLNHNAVMDAAVIGKPDEECGELPTAFVVKDPKSTITEKEIMDYVSQRVSPAKRLRGGVIFINEIPKTYSGKTLKMQLKKILLSKSKL